MLTTKDKATLEKFLREGGPHKLEINKRFELRQSLDLPVGKSAAARLQIQPDALRSVLDTNAREKALLTIDEVQVPAKQDVFVRVFVNKPDATAATPIEDPHYAGSFAFFCCQEEHHEGAATPTPTPPRPAAATPPRAAATPAPTAATNQKLRYLVDATPTVRRLSQAGSLSSDLQVTLVTVPIEEQRRVETQKLTVGRVELATAAV
jgi:tyrosinase